MAIVMIKIQDEADGLSAQITVDPHTDPDAPLTPAVEVSAMLTVLLQSELVNHLNKTALDAILSGEDPVKALEEAYA